MKAELAKTPTSRLKDARVKYHQMKLHARVSITQLEQRKQMLIKLLSPCNAYDVNTEAICSESSSCLLAEDISLSRVYICMEDDHSPSISSPECKPLPTVLVGSYFS